MPRFYNQYSPQTDIGSGLNNAIGALFSGKGPKDTALDAAHSEAYLASAESSRASAAKHRTEAEVGAAGLGARQNFLEDSLKLLGPVRAGGARSYLNTGETPREAVTSETEAGPIGVQDANWFTPRARRDLDTTAQLASLLMSAEPSKIDELAKARMAIQGGVEEAGVLEGSVDPTRFFQSRGKPTSSVDEGYAVNMADPSVSPRELGIATALIGERNAQAGKYRSEGALDAEKVNTEKARQGELKSRAGNNSRGNKLVAVLDDDGSTVWMPAAEAAGQKVGASNPVKKPLSKTQSQIIAEAINGLERDLGDSGSIYVPDAALDADTKAALNSRATQLTIDPSSDFYQDPAGAVHQALSELEITQDRGWNPFSAGKLVAKGRILDAQLGKVPAVPTRKAPDRTGKTDAQLLDEANTAIRKGANRDAVMKRLRDMGVRAN